MSSGKTTFIYVAVVVACVFLLTLIELFISVGRRRKRQTRPINRLCAGA